MNSDQIDPELQHIASFLEKSNFNHLLQLRVLSLKDGSCRVLLPWSDQLVGDPSRQIAHGGALATLIDTATGAACFSKLEDRDDRISTVDMRVDFLEPGYPADLFCDAKVVRMGNRVAVAHGEVYSNLKGKSKKLIATGTTVYNVVRKKN